MPRFMKVLDIQVPCPYCKVGRGAAVVHVHDDGTESLQDAKEPRKCNLCGGYFALKLQINLVGVPFERPGKPPSQGDLLRAITGTGG